MEERQPSLREAIRSALGFWERGRIAFNASLVAVVVARFVVELPVSDLRWHTVLELYILAVLANVLYTTAYPIDVMLQLAGLRTDTRSWRLAIWAIGTVFAVSLALLVSGGLFVPDVID